LVYPFEEFNALKRQFKPEKTVRGKKRKADGKTLLFERGIVSEG
jgi:hypothetical protein